MRLHRSRKSSNVSAGRRHRRVADSEQSSPAFAYRSRRPEQEQGLGRQMPRETGGATSDRVGVGHFFLRRFGLIILLVALVVSSVNVLSLSSSARVVSLNGSSSSFLHDTTVYQAAASQILATSIWNRNKITVNTAAVSQQMLKQFPELSSASVTLPLLSKRPIVYVQTAQPALILAARSGSFILDTNGKALLRTDNLPSGTSGNQLKLPLVTDQSGLDVRLNRQALSSGDVNFIQTVIAQLAARHFSVSSSVLPVGTSELDVHLAGQPYSVKFNLQSGDAKQQAGTFLATQAKLQSQHVTPAQYIDVRVDGRAYYK